MSYYKRTLFDPVSHRGDPSVICGEERENLYSGVLITESNIGTLPQKSTFYHAG